MEAGYVPEKPIDKVAKAAENISCAAVKSTDKVAKTAERIAHTTVESTKKAVDVVVKSTEKVVAVAVELNEEGSADPPKNTSRRFLKSAKKFHGESATIANEMLGLVAETRSTNFAVATDAGKEVSAKLGQLCRW